MSSKTTQVLEKPQPNTFMIALAKLAVNGWLDPLRPLRDLRNALCDRIASYPKGKKICLAFKYPLSTASNSSFDILPTDHNECLRMIALRKKYKDHKEDVLASVHVTNDLLALLTREGLLDIADCVRYQGMANMRERTQAFLEMLVERSSERAYRVLIQGLRETGQSTAADLLTDAEEEMNLIAQLQKLLEERIESIDGFIQNEVDMVGFQKRSSPREKKPCGHPKQNVTEKKSRLNKGTNEAETAAQESRNKEIWRNAQESMRRASEQLERCNLVIGKLHKDCYAAMESKANLTSQTKDCYIQLSKMIRPSNTHGKDLPSTGQSIEELYQLLVDDVHRLMSRERKTQEREMEGRTNAMRTLRQLRDWILDRAGILTSLHSTFRPLGNPRFKPHHPAAIGHSTVMTSSSKHQAGSSSQRLLISPDRSESLNFNDPGAVLAIENSMLPENDSSLGGQKALLPVPFATSTPRPSESEGRQHSLTIEPMSTLVEGVNILEKQLREYIHLEILLTDKFRFEMRMKQHQQKAQGFTPKGINEVRSIIGQLSSSNENTELDSIHKLRGQLERMSSEYAEIGKYMDKVISSMNHIGDVDQFLKTLYEREKQYKKDLNKPEKKSKGKTKNDEVKDSFTNLVEMFKTGQKNQTSTKSSKPISKPTSTMSREKMRLPSITNPDQEPKSPDDLLTKLKVLVANFEIVRLRMLTIEDRYRRELSRRERKFEAALRSREDDLYRLQTALNEAEAEKDKYLRLYNSTKLSMVRKK